MMDHLTRFRLDPTSDNSADPKTFRFLSLPLEIRQFIYEELLFLKPTSDNTIYYDQDGGNPKLTLHPQILRVSQQISAEATNLLYESNVFSISLLSRVDISCARFPRKGGPPQALIRRDGIDKPCSMHFQEPRLLYPHVLRRMSNLKIVVSPHAVWGHGMMGGTFSHIGELLLELLRLLSHDESNPEVGTQTPKKKQLALHVYKVWHNDYGGSVLFPRSDGSPNFRNHCHQKDEKLQAAEMSPLIDTISKERVVSLEKYLWMTDDTTDNAENESQESSTWYYRKVPLDEFQDL